MLIRLHLLFVKQQGLSDLGFLDGVGWRRRPDLDEEETCGDKVSGVRPRRRQVRNSNAISARRIRVRTAPRLTDLSEPTSTPTDR
jgi:hypothetical protein